MKNSKTGSLILLAALLIFSLINLLGGFYPVKAAEEELRLMVWTWSDEMDDALDRAIEEYEEQSGISINLIRVVDKTKSHVEYNYQLSECFYRARSPDVLWMDHDWMDDEGFLVYLSSLDEFFNSQEPETVLGISSELLLPFQHSAGSDELQLYGIPLGTDGLFAQSAYAISKMTYRSERGELAFNLIMFLRNRIPPLPADFTTSDLFITPGEVDIGEEITIGALITNTGNLPGSHEVTFKINDEVIRTEEVTLAGGASQMVSCTTTKDVDGTYVAIVDNLSRTFVVKAAMVAAFTTSDLFITLGEVDIGEEITIGVLITNTGNLSGSHEVTFKINDEVIRTEEVTLAGGTSRMITCTTAVYDVGSYSVAVDGLSGSFTVVQPPLNWPLIRGCIGAAAAVSVTFVVLRFKKKKRRREWQEKAKETEPGETSKLDTRYCRKIELESEGAAYKIKYLNLNFVNSISEEKSNRKVRGEIVDWLNDAVIAHRQGEKTEELQTRLKNLADKLLQKSLKWLRAEKVPQHVSILAHLEGGKVTSQFILYQRKQRRNVNVWEEEDKWEATIDYKHDELVGTLHRLDPIDPNLSERQAELVGLLMKFMESR